MSKEYKGPERRQNGKSRRAGDNGWHLNRGVPIALILTIIIQTGGLIWYVRGVTAQIDNNTSAVQELKKVPERLLVLEVLMRRVEASLERRREAAP